MLQADQGRWVGAGQLKAVLHEADEDTGLAELVLRVAANRCIDGAPVYMCAHLGHLPA